MLIHEGNRIHRDLKPSNILLTKDFRIKLADFGLCCNIKEVLPESMVQSKYKISETLPFEGVYTLAYAAPEQLQNKVKRRSEVWTLGMIACFLITKVHPYSEFGNNMSEIHKSIANADLPWTFYSAIRIFPELKGLMTKLLQKDYNLRPKMF